VLVCDFGLLSPLLLLFRVVRLLGLLSLLDEVGLLTPLLLLLLFGTHALGLPDGPDYETQDS
jgi:hypothetical protein